jgi:regulator of RNase E activity RraA
MTITIAATAVAKTPAALIEAFRAAPTSIISDNLARLAGSVGLRPFHRAGRLVGTAFTVRTRPGDNLAIHHALDAGFDPRGSLPEQLRQGLIDMQRKARERR